MWKFLTGLDSNVLRGLLVAVASLIGLIVNSIFNISEDAWGEKAEKIIDAVIQIVALGGALWAGYARINMPNPNLTEAAKAKEVQLIERGKIPVEKASVEAAQIANTSVSEKVQGGFARLGMLGALLAALLATLTVIGCATLGAAQPQTFSEKATAGYETVTALANLTSVLLDAGKIEVKDGRNVHTQLTNLKEGIDIAVALKAAGNSDADSRLEVTIKALTLLQSYLALKELENGR
jgi:hypothetical protein